MVLETLKHKKSIKPDFYGYVAINNDKNAYYKKE